MLGWLPTRMSASRGRTFFRPAAGLALLLGLAYLPGSAVAQGKAGEGNGPRICVMTPLDLVAGTNSTLKIRGLKLSGATGVTITAASQNIKAEIREKKTVEVSKGLEAKDVGDSLAEIEIVVPSGLAGGELMISLITPEGKTQPRAVRVVDGGLFVDEKEPNDGFRNAQVLPPGKGVHGTIGSDKDVDVYAITGHAKKVLVAELFAARAGSLLDAVLTLYDEKGRVLASCDDSGGSRDPQLRFKLPVDGKYFLAIQDASDHGSPWHAYALSAKEEP
jgi:hypothetical protein